LCSIEFAIREIPNEYSTKYENFRKRIPETQILILGSSHALRGINPHCFELDTYNMAMVAQGIRMDHDILLKYGKDFNKLRYVFVSISYFTLSQKITSGELAKRLCFYRFFYGLNFKELSPYSINHYSLESAIGFHDSLVDVARYLTGDRIIACDSLGWLGEAGILVQELSDLGKDAALTAARHEDGSLDFTANLGLLKEMCHWSQQKDVELILVNTPKTPWYIRNLSKRKMEKIDVVIKNLCDEFPNVHYFNFQSDRRFLISDFRNSDHVNMRGAQKLSLLLNDYLK